MKTPLDTRGSRANDSRSARLGKKQPGGTHAHRIAHSPDGGGVPVSTAQPASATACAAGLTLPALRMKHLNRHVSPIALTDGAPKPIHRYRRRYL
jgi:hypothetical protein